MTIVDVDKMTTGLNSTSLNRGDRFTVFNDNIMHFQRHGRCACAGRLGELVPAACADPESFFRVGPTLTTFFPKIPLKAGHHRPASETAQY